MICLQNNPVALLAITRSVLTKNPIYRLPQFATRFFLSLLGTLMTYKHLLYSHSILFQMQQLSSTNSIDISGYNFLHNLSHPWQLLWEETNDTKPSSPWFKNIMQHDNRTFYLSLFLLFLSHRQHVYSTWIQLQNHHCRRWLFWLIYCLCSFKRQNQKVRYLGVWQRRVRSCLGRSIYRYVVLYQQHVNGTLLISCMGIGRHQQGC